MTRFGRTAVAVVAVAGTLYLTPAGSSAQTLPSQASPIAEEHTHGPDGLNLDRRGRPGVAAAGFDVDLHEGWSAGEYDKTALGSDATDVSPPAGRQMFHAIYVYPSDKASRFSTYAAMFQADARQASRHLEVLYGRAVRFDMRASYLDITVFKSKHNARQLAGARQFDLVNNELGAAGFTASNKKYVVWLDAGSKYCGQGHLAQDTQRVAGNANQGRSLAIVYRPYAMTDPSTGGFCRGRTLLHELGHTMGALQNVAPHAYDGAHCNDSNEDTMCYVSGSADTGPAEFDYGNDDYWDPLANPKFGTVYPPSAPDGKLRWWTVNLSAFLCDAPGSCDAAAAVPNY